MFMRPAPFFAGVTLAAAALAMFFLVRDARIPILQPMGPIAAAQMKVIMVTFMLSSLVIVPVFVLLFYFAWKYRAHGPDTQKHHHPTWDHESPMAEFFWWLIPSGIIAILAVVAWQSSHAPDPHVPIPGEKTLEVQVVALN